jgi:hypothetical protein
VNYDDPGSFQNPYAASQVDTPFIDEAVDMHGPEGIGGWLILPLIGLVLTPLGAVVALLTQQIPAFTEGHFSRLTDPNFVNYHPLWGPLLILEPLATITLAAMAIWALVLMARKKKAFPRLMIAFYTFSVVYMLIDTTLGLQIPHIAAEGKAELIGQMLRAGIVAAIWIPYMRVSRRVKNTFVN